MKKAWFIWCFVLLFCFSGCTHEPLTTEFFAMDTMMKITVYSNKDENLAADAKEKVISLEHVFSVTNPNSEIYKANNAGGTSVSLSAQTIELLQTALKLQKETNGLFDVTVYPAVKAWGFTTKENRVPTKEELEALLPLINSSAIQLKNNTLTLPKGVSLDFGGIAKGYAADVIANDMLKQGCSGAVLAFGGNIKTVGNKPNGELFQIAVQDPTNTNGTLGTLSVQGNIAVVTSGDYQRSFEANGVTYHHIIDPRTAAPAKSDLTSVTVICSSATRADAYATALYIMGLVEGMKFVESIPDVEALFVTKTKEVYKTSGLSTTFQPDNKNYTFH